MPTWFPVTWAPGVARPIIPTPLHAALPLLLGTLWLMAVSRSDLARMNDLGLVSVLPTGAVALLCVLTGSFSLALTGRPVSPVVALIHVVVLVLVLYGVTTYLEAVPRSATVYKHSGVIDYIAGRGSVDPTIDAYFNWPGFFALGALVTKVAGFDSPLAFAAWGPLVFNLLFLPPLVAILRSASDDARVTWLGVWIFYVTNWVGQDIIAPQAVGYLLWLAILAVLLRYFAKRGAVRTLHPRRSLLALWAERQEDASLGSGQRAGLLVLVVVVFCAVVTGHQLTPFAAIVTCVGLVLVAELSPRTLPLTMAIITAAWISYVATAYLAGNIETLVRPVGAVGDNLNQNVAGRYAGSPEHLLIVQIRTFSSVAIWALAVAGLVRRLRARRGDFGLAAAGAAPFLLAVLQPYGGEMLLRVFLFTLPAVAFFIACLAFPSPSTGRGWLATLAVAAVGCALVVTFQFTRYGNERLEYFSKGDIAAVRHLYRIAPAGSTLVSGSGNIPWRYRNYVGYEYGSVTDLRAWDAPNPSPRRLSLELERKYASTGAFVIITRSTEVYAGLLEGKPAALPGLARQLRDAPGVREVYSQPDGKIFALGRRRA